MPSDEVAVIQRELMQAELLGIALELREAAHALARRRAHLSSDHPMRFGSMLFGIDPDISERIAENIESGEDKEPGDTSPAEWREIARVQRALIALADRICAPLPDGTQPAFDPDSSDPAF